MSQSAGARPIPPPVKPVKPRVDMPWSIYTADEGQRLLDLKQKQRLSWRQIALRFPGRSRGALRTHHYRLKGYNPSNSKADQLLPEQRTRQKKTTSGRIYSAEENRLLLRLKEEGLTWPDLAPAFPGPESNLVADALVHQSGREDIMICHGQNKEVDLSLSLLRTHFTLAHRRQRLGSKTGYGIWLGQV